MVEVTIAGKALYLDDFLKEKLDLMKDMQKKNWDIIIPISGMERSGKSTLAFICAWYLSDGKITTDNIIIDTQDCIEKLGRLPPKSVLVIDEGVLLFLARDVMTSEAKILSKILMIVGQKNLVLITCIPSFFELNKYIATHRARCLLHVYTSTSYERGRFCYFSEKQLKRLYENGKKNYGSMRDPPAQFVGRFPKFEPPFYEEYLKIKHATLMKAMSAELTANSKVIDKSALKINELRVMQKNAWLGVLKRLNSIKGLSESQKASILGLSARNLRRYGHETALLAEEIEEIPREISPKADKRANTLITLEDDEETFEKIEGGEPQNA